MLLQKSINQVLYDNPLPSMLGRARELNHVQWGNTASTTLSSGRNTLLVWVDESEGGEKNPFFPKGKDACFSLHAGYSLQLKLEQAALVQ